MERLDFSLVMAVLRRNIPDENSGNQADFLESLFLDLGFSPQTAIEFDQEKDNQWKLLRRIKENLLPIMPDGAMAAQELYDLVLQATNVSLQKKMELTDGYTFEDDLPKVMIPGSSGITGSCVACGRTRC